MSKILTPSYWGPQGGWSRRHARQRRLDVMASWVGDPEPGTKWIPLQTGAAAIVDECDYEWLNQWVWTFSGGGYVSAFVERRQTPIHRMILDAQPGDCVDHKNRNPLDNRRCNIRLCTQRDNVINRVKFSQWECQYKGIKVTKSGKRWGARIRDGFKSVWLGTFSTPEEAAMAYNEAAMKFHNPEFAILNVIKP